MVKPRGRFYALTGFFTLKDYAKYIGLTRITRPAYACHSLKRQSASFECRVRAF
jgi:hypothetical protein